MQVILHDNAGGDDPFPADNTSKAYYNWYWLICQIAEKIADIPEKCSEEGKHPNSVRILFTPLKMPFTGKIVT